MNVSKTHDWPSQQLMSGPDELVLAAVPLIETIVDELAARVRGPLDRDHLTSVALVAALDAAHAYDEDVDGFFPRYVSALLRSALLGEIRGGHLRPGPEDRIPAEPADDDEPIAALARGLHELTEREVELTDDLMEHPRPELLGELIQVRTEALGLVRRAMTAREAAPSGAPERAAARGSAFAAVLGGFPMATRSSAPARWGMGRREA